MVVKGSKDNPCLLGEFIRVINDALSITRGEMFEETDVNIHTISAWLTSKSEPSLLHCNQIIKLYNTKIQNLKPNDESRLLAYIKYSIDISSFEEWTKKELLSLNILEDLIRAVLMKAKAHNKYVNNKLKEINAIHHHELENHNDYIKKRFKDNLNLNDYYASFKEEFEEEMPLIKGYSLNDLYIKPNYKIADFCTVLDCDDYSSVNLQNLILMDNSEIDKSFIYGFKHTNITFLLGDPGQGKSTFCKKIIYDFASSSSTNLKYERVLLTKLISLKNDMLSFRSSPLDSLLKSYPTNTIENLNIEQLNNCLLILDGFDELYMSLEKVNIDLREFIASLQEDIFKHQKYLIKFHILITSRKNYVNLETLRDLNIRTYFLTEMTVEQQLEWIMKYNNKNFQSCANIGQEYIELVLDPDKKIKQMLQIPLLFCCIMHFKIGVNLKNRSEVYSDLFDKIVNAKYEKIPYNLKPVYERFRKTEFTHILETLAYNIFCYNDEYLGINEVKKTLEELNSNEIDNSFIDGLLIAFYFVRNENTIPTIEFMHRSFYEYFLSHYIYKHIKNILKSIREKKEIDMNIERLLYCLYRRILSEDILNFIKELFYNDKEIIKVNEYETILQYLVTTQCLLKNIATTEILEAAKNIFKNSINILSEFNSETFIQGVLANDISKIILHFGGEGLNLRNQNFSHLKLCYTRFNNSNLNTINFTKADLNNSIFTDSEIKNAKFLDTILNNSNFMGANLSFSDFTNAKLKIAIFTKARMEGANLTCADLTNAFLDQVIGKSTKFIESTLNDANLSKSDFCEADFSNAKLEHINICKTNLQGANFTNANLKGAVFTKANMDSTNLSDADLTYASLDYISNANKIKFNRTILNYANLAGSDFREAIFNNVELKYINISETNLQGADLTTSEFLPIIQSIKILNLLNSRINNKTKEYLQHNGISSEHFELLGFDTWQIK